jgi:hypothetical protein
LLIDLGAADLMLVRGGGEDLVCSNIGDTLYQPTSLLSPSTTGREEGSKVERTFAESGTHLTDFT